jgi:hypothetical protein
MQRYEIILNASCIIHNFFVPLIDIECRLRLGKTQINLVFRSICTTFAPCMRIRYKINKV